MSSSTDKSVLADTDRRPGLPYTPGEGATQDSGEVMQRSQNTRTRKSATVAVIALSVVMGSLPVFMTEIDAVSRGGSVPWPQVLGRGDLLLVAAVLCSTALAETLVGTARRSGMFGVKDAFAAVTAVVVLAFSSMWLADIATIIRDGQHLNVDMVTKGSLIVLGLSVLVAAQLMVVARQERP